MSLRKYKYTGKETMHLIGFGNVEPGQTIETTLEINHPLFEEVIEKEEKSKKVSEESV